MRHGRFGVGELSIDESTPVGIRVRAINHDPSVAGPEDTYSYKGLASVLGDYLYLIMGEISTHNELLFMTVLMPTGGARDHLLGHMLVRGLRGGENKSAVSPVVLLRRERLNAAQLQLRGEVNPQTVMNAGLLGRRELRHLLDAPTARLRNHFGDLREEDD